LWVKKRAGHKKWFHAPWRTQKVCGCWAKKTTGSKKKGQLLTGGQKFVGEGKTLHVSRIKKVAVYLHKIIGAILVEKRKPGIKKSPLANKVMGETGQEKVGR